MDTTKTILYSVKPNFSLVYEMFMPTGKKLRTTVIILIILVVCYILISLTLNDPNIMGSSVMNGNSVAIIDIFNKISAVIIGVIAIKLAFNLIVQIWQYKSITYTFYDDYLEYEDTFLNQHKKTLRYDNVREIEIRRTVWDRLNGYGVIVISTNADNMANNGLILYSIKDPQKTYDILDEIIHKRLSVKNTDNERPVQAEPITESEKEFKDSLNNKE